MLFDHRDARLCDLAQLDTPFPDRVFAAAVPLGAADVRRKALRNAEAVTFFSDGSAGGIDCFLCGMVSLCPDLGLVERINGCKLLLEIVGARKLFSLSRSINSATTAPTDRKLTLDRFCANFRNDAGWPSTRLINFVIWIFPKMTSRIAGQAAHHRGLVTSGILQ